MLSASLAVATAQATGKKPAIDLKDFILDAISPVSVAMKRSAGVAFEAISELRSPSKNAKLEGKISRLSPMKQGKAISFFDGEISDGNASVRLYGFDKTLREKIESSVVANESVTLSGCEVRATTKKWE